jgi:indole-3-glycerol phosphate synthase
MSTPTILKTIVSRKWEEVAALKRRVSLADLEDLQQQQTPVRDFEDAIVSRCQRQEAAVIAEVKKASPSKGVIRENFNPAEIAHSYASGGAACLSVLTDIDFFQGHDDYLRQARGACDIPVLRKDFTVDPVQIAEARAIGADAILLIAAVLDDAELQDLFAVATAYQLHSLIEVHNGQELERALKLGASMLGINNRDLHTFNTDLNTTIRLLSEVPEGVSVVTESGIHSRADVSLMRSKGVHGFLIGEAFMREPDPGLALRALFESDQ